MGMHVFKFESDPSYFPVAMLFIFLDYYSSKYCLCLYFRRYSKDITDFIVQLTKSEIATSVKKNGKPCLEFYTGTEEVEKADGSQSASTCQQSNSVRESPQYDQVSILTKWYYCYFLKIIR